MGDIIEKEETIIPTAQIVSEIDSSVSSNNNDNNHTEILQAISVIIPDHRIHESITQEIEACICRGCSQPFIRPRGTKRATVDYISF